MIRLFPFRPVSLLLLLSPLFLFSQAWKDRLDASQQENFFALQRSFQDYWKDRKIEKGKGYKVFKRWEWFWQTRVDAQGNFPAPQARQEALNYTRTHLSPAHTQFKSGNVSGNATANRMATQSASWNCLGPFSSPGGYTGNGRVNTIGFHPTQAGNYFVGAPAGGLWHTTDDGLTWTTTTDLLPSLGAGAVVVDWSNTQNIYLGSGDGDGTDTHSLGVLKSTDGGLTWSTTGLSWTPGQYMQVNRLLQDPVDPFVLMAGTSDGIYRTTDGGINWTQVETDGVRDLEMKPGDPNTWYAATYRNANDVRVLRTTNAGVTWSTVYTNTNSNRINIAVTPANPALVALLSSEDGSNGLEGIYKSLTSGSSGSFTQVFSPTTANLLDYTDDGSGSGGQGWYDLAFEIDPSNASIWYTGGINVWKSTDAGVSWTCKTMWYSSPGLAEVHADQHFLAFQPNRPSHLFACNDGGVFITTDGGDNWTELTHLQQGPVIGQYYRISNSFYNPHIILGGLQDNGSKLLDHSGFWVEATGGDGMECIIDPVDSTIMYGSYVNGYISRSNDGGQTFATNISANLPNPDNGAWVTPYCLDPNDHSTIFIAYDEVYKSTDNGDNFTTISNGIPTGTPMDYIEVCIANSNRMYTGTHDDVYRTLNGGALWTNITPSPHVGSFTSLVSDPENEDRIWLANSSYSGSIQVYYSSNGGSTWSDYSGSLPDIPVNTIIYERGTQDGLYIGTDIGVYYRDNSLGDWVYYSDGLPVTVVSDLEIHYTSGMLRAGTYGRGVWESPLYISSDPGTPGAGMTASANIVCAGYPVSFTDISTNNPTSWCWTFPGASPAVSTQQNPVVTYQTPGTYTVSLIVSNTNGTSYVSQMSYIVVQFSPTATAILTGAPCVGNTVQLTGNVLAGSTYSWQGPGGFNANTSSASLSGLTLSQSGSYSYYVTQGGCSSAPAVVNISVVPYPAAPINVASNSPVCLPATLKLSCTFSGGGNAVWNGPGSFNSTQQNPVVSNPQSGTYSVYADNTGCASAVVQLSVAVIPQIAKPVITQAGFILTSSAPSGNQWYRNGVLLTGETGTSLDCSLYPSGDFTVVVSDGNGCSSEASDLVRVLFTAADKLDGEEALFVNPNPFTDWLDIRYAGKSELVSVRLTDALGREMYVSGTIIARKYRIPASGIPVGIYWLRIQDARGNEVVRRVLKR